MISYRGSQLAYYFKVKEESSMIPMCTLVMDKLMILAYSVFANTSGNVFREATCRPFF